MSYNIYQEIQDAVIDKFGVNSSAELIVKIYPLQAEYDHTLKIKKYEIQPNSTTKILYEVFLNAAALGQFPKMITELEV